MTSRIEATTLKTPWTFEVARARQDLRGRPGYREQSDSEWWNDFIGDKYLRVFGYTETPDGKKVATRRNRVRDQLSFIDVDPRSPDDVATYRTARELVMRGRLGTEPLAEFWKLKTASPTLMKLAKERWRAYREAFLKAKAHLDKIVLPFKLSDVASPADALQNLNTGRWNTTNARSLAEQLSPEEAERLSRPEAMAHYLSRSLRTGVDADVEAVVRRNNRRPTLLKHLDFLCRAAAGLVGESDMMAFFSTDFPQFSLDEKLTFLRFCHDRPTKQLKNLLSFRRAWLQHNAPVFSAFGWPRDWRRAVVASWRAEARRWTGGASSGGAGSFHTKPRLEELRNQAARHPGNPDSSAYVQDGPDELEEEFEQLQQEIRKLERTMTGRG